MTISSFISSERPGVNGSTPGQENSSTSTVVPHLVVAKNTPYVNCPGVDPPWFFTVKLSFIVSPTLAEPGAESVPTVRSGREGEVTVTVVSPMTCSISPRALNLEV